MTLHEKMLRAREAWLAAKRLCEAARMVRDEAESKYQKSFDKWVSGRIAKDKTK
jgi:hypothetical protein